MAHDIELAIIYVPSTFNSRETWVDYKDDGYIYSQGTDALDGQRLCRVYIKIKQEERKKTLEIPASPLSRKAYLGTIRMSLISTSPSAIAKM